MKFLASTIFFAIVALMLAVLPAGAANCPPNGPFPNPHITSSFRPDTSCTQGQHDPGSAGGDKRDCLYACENQYATYCVSPVAGSTYAWVAAGGAIASGQGTNCVTVFWGPAGPGQLTVTETNAVGCTGTDVACVKIINSPLAAFTVDTTACRNVILNFTNLSLNGVSYFWDFGDGNTSTLFSPTHAYTAGGTYTVTLVVANLCGCKDSATATIQVSNLTGPNILCPATVCAFAEACYYTFDTCATAVYHWNVTGGAIVGPTTNSTICIQWGPGPVGTISLSVTGCGTMCPDTTTVTVPIIGNTAAIAGPLVVCPGDIANYAVPTWPGTYYAWTLSGGGGIIAGAYTQTATVQWGVAPGFYTLDVTWNNILLGCGGHARVTVEVRNRFSVVGSSGPFCIGDSSYYGANAPANWTVTGGTISGPFTGTTSILVHWTTAGVQTVSATVGSPASFCNLADSLHVVVDSVPKAASIAGPQVICAGGTYQYTASPSGPGYTLQWSVTGGGTIVGSSTGTTVSVTWSSGGTVAVQQVKATPPACKSDTISLAVTVFSLAAISGPGAVCMDQTVSYSAGPPQPALDFQWSIVDGSGNPSPFGSITGGQGTSQINVLWHGPGNNTAFVKLKICGATYLLPISINPVPTPTITMTGHVCDPGGSVILTANPAGMTYLWSNSANTQSIVVNASGTYSVAVTGPGGCTGSISIVVPHTPGPVASISTPDPTNYCGTPPPPVNSTLYALQGPGYTYLWSPGNQVTPTITANAAGSYSVTVTDANGCSATSNVITITTGACPTGGCVPTGTASFTFVAPVCNPVQFNGSSTGVPSPAWNFDDPASGVNNTSALTNPLHLFTHAGYFNVSYGGLDASGCPVSATHAVAVPLAADFTSAGACGTYSFTDQSTYLPPNAITTWTWTFSGGTPASSNAQNPTGVTFPSGAHSVTLTVQNGTCSVSITKTINVGAAPTGVISLAATGCANNSIGMNGSGAGIATWSWDFGDGATSATQTTSHAYTTAGTYLVKLTVADAFGCSSFSTQSITITAPIAGCTLTPAGPTTFCQPGSVTLNASPTGGGYSYQWYLNGALVPGSGSAYSATQSGNYTVVITDGSGCTCNAGPVSVIANPAPPATITPNQIPVICGSGLITLCAPSGPYTYLWSDGGATTTQCLTLFLNTPGPQSFTVTVTDPSTGCSAVSAAFTVFVFPAPAPPTITPGGPTTLCKGSSVTLTSSSPTGNLWNTGATTQSITVSTPGTYTVTVTDPNGCSATGSIAIKADYIDFSLFPFGCDDLCDTVKIPGPIGPYPGYYNYQWLFNGLPIAAPNGTNDTLTPVGTGLYSVILTGPGPSFCTDTSGQYNLTLKNCDSCFGRICGRKWNDANGNHKFNYGTEFGIPHWKFCLVKCNVDGYPGKDTVACTYTDSLGFYCFNNVPCGCYAVVEEHRAGWAQTWPINPPFYHVVVGENQNLGGFDFGNKFKCIDIWTTQDTIGIPPYASVLPSDVVLPSFHPWPVRISYSSDQGTTWSMVFNGLLPIDLQPVVPCLHGTYSIVRKHVSNYQFDRIYVNGVLVGDDGTGNSGDSVVVDVPDSGTGVSILLLQTYHPDQSLKFRTFTAAQLAQDDQAKPVKRPKPGGTMVLPNTANVIDEILKQRVALVCGLPGQFYNAKQMKGYLQPSKQAEVFKTFNTKGTTHSGAPRAFTFDIKHNLILKRQKSMPATKHNNVFLANLLALKINIWASATGKTPPGFGELIYAPAEGSPWYAEGPECSVAMIAGLADSLFTTPDASVSDQQYLELNALLEQLNASFAGSLPLTTDDTASWVGSPKLALNGVRLLSDVPYLIQVAGAHTEWRGDQPAVPAQDEPDAPLLDQNYPNPFNPTTVISFTLPDAANVTLKVFDVLGQEVATLIDHQLLDEGSQQVTFDASKLSSGVYFYRLVAETAPAADAAPEDGAALQVKARVSIRKMLLMR